MALRFQLGSETLLGGYTVAAMTDASMRGQGLFVKTSRHLHQRCEELGFAFLAGFSNANSMGPTSGPIGRTPLRPFPWCARVLRPIGLLRDLTGRPEPPQSRVGRREYRIGSTVVEEIECDDARLDELWQRVSPDFQIGAIRDRSFSAWRYAGRPDAGYRVLLVQVEGRPAASVCYRFLPFRGLRSAFLLDFLVAPGEKRAARLLLKAVTDMARREGAVLLSALLPGRGPSRDVLLRGGLIRIPTRFHPQSIVFTVKGLGAYAEVPELTRPSAWFYSWADLDLV
jgi:hypothetical protein